MTIAVIALADGINGMINMYYNGVVLIDELRKSTGLDLHILVHACGCSRFGLTVRR